MTKKEDEEQQRQQKVTKTKKNAMLQNIYIDRQYQQPKSEKVRKRERKRRKRGDVRRGDWIKAKIHKSKIEMLIKVVCSRSDLICTFEAWNRMIDFWTRICYTVVHVRMLSLRLVEMINLMTDLSKFFFNFLRRFDSFQLEERFCTLVFYVVYFSMFT